MKLRKFRQNLGRTDLPSASLIQMETRKNGSSVEVPGRSAALRRSGLGDLAIWKINLVVLSITYTDITQAVLMVL